MTPFQTLAAVLSTGVGTFFVFRAGLHFGAAGLSVGILRKDSAPFDDAALEGGGRIASIRAVFYAMVGCVLTFTGGFMLGHF